MEERLVLGICSSPRPGANTDIALAAALEAAAEVPGIRTETIYLRDYPDIRPCQGCYACSPPDQSRDSKYACPMHRDDDMNKIYPKLLECSGLILASPVYFGSVTGTMKMFMDRTEPLLRYGAHNYKYGLRHKVGGGIAVGGNRNAGEESTIQTIINYFLIHDMLPVGSGPQRTPGCYIGGGATTWPNDKDSGKNGILKDALGLQSCRNLGRNVAETVIRVGAGPYEVDDFTCLSPLA
ncbi:MAG: flavodoxin family protein [Lachnospiraceae bacterium]|nr:flavodoxin family protein [Lachnospiraceae bacterium]